MARSSLNNNIAAVNYYFNRAVNPVAPLHDIRNNVALSSCDSTDTTSIHIASVDTDSKVRVDREVQTGCRQSITFNLALNAGLATQAFFIADRPMGITGIEYRHTTAGNDAAAVTAVITHETGTTAPGSGTVTMTNTFNCKGTAEVVQNATLLSVDGNGDINSGLVLASGDRLSILFSGTLTTLAGVVVTVYLVPGFKEQTAQFVANANALITTQGFFVANRDMQITGVKMIWSTAGTDSGTVTGDVTIEGSTTAPGSGTSCLAAAQSLKTTANTVVSPALSATAANTILAAGQRLSFLTSGTLTALAGLVVVVYMQAKSDVNGTSLPYYGQVDVNFNIKANGSQATQAFWVADRDYEVVDVSYINSTAGTDGGTVTFDVGIAKGTTAPASATSVLTAAFSAKTTANTVVYAGDGTYTLTVARRKRLLSQGDRLCAVYAGTLTALAGVDATVSLLPR